MIDAIVELTSSLTPNRLDIPHTPENTIRSVVSLMEWIKYARHFRECRIEIVIYFGYFKTLSTWICWHTQFLQKKYSLLLFLLLQSPLAVQWLCSSFPFRKRRRTTNQVLVQYGRPIFFSSLLPLNYLSVCVYVRQYLLQTICSGKSSFFLKSNRQWQKMPSWFPCTYLYVCVCVY